RIELSSTTSHRAARFSMKMPSPAGGLGDITLHCALHMAISAQWDQGFPSRPIADVERLLKENRSRELSLAATSSPKDLPDGARALLLRRYACRSSYRGLGGWQALQSRDRSPHKRAMDARLRSVVRARMQT